MNYFELFALTRSYVLDTNELRAKYLELQRAVHPDKFANASEQNRLLAVQQSARINDGFGMLKTPINRAEYLLLLAGIELSHEYQTIKDPTFLMEQMELNWVVLQETVLLMLLISCLIKLVRTEQEQGKLLMVVMGLVLMILNL